MGGVIFVLGVSMAFERAAYLEAIVGADITQFRKAMRDIRNDMGILAENTGNKLASIGRTATYTLTAPLVAAGTAAIETAAAFENSMRNVNSMAQLNEQGFKAMSAAVLDWGSQTTFGATKASEALYSIISAGYTDMPMAMEVMRNSTMLAEATQAELMGTTEALTAVMLSYAGSNMTAADAANIMARITQMGVGSQDDYNRTMQKTLPLANALGIEFADLGAVQAVVSQNGSGLDKAGTSVAMALSNLLKPTEAMKKGFEELGVATGRELIDKFGGLSEGIAALRANSSEIDFAKMFSKTGLEAAFTLTNNLDQTNAKLVEFKSSIEGAVDASRGEQMKSFTFQMNLLKSAVEGAAIVIGEVLIPAITPLVNEVARFFTNLRQLNPEIIQMGVVMGAVVAAGAPLMWLLGSLLNPVGLLIAAVGALLVAFETNFGGIATTVSKVVNDVKTELQPLTDLISEFINTVSPEQAGGLDLSWLIPDQAAIDAALASGAGVTIPADQVITIEDGDTLWSIWASDFKDKMTWDEFKKASGWSKGMVLHPGDIITLEGVPSDVVTDAGWTLTGMFEEFIPEIPPITLDPNKIFTNIEGGAQVIADKLFPQQSILDKINTAAATFIPKFLEVLGGLLTAGVQWADQQLGKGLDWLAGLFQPGNGTGKSPIYTAFMELLEGDLWGALDAIIPGLGTKIGTTLTDAVAGITDGTLTTAAGSAMGRLISAFGEWLLTEGVPTLSRSFGYMMGMMGTSIVQGIGDMLSNVNPGAAANAAGSVVEGLGTAVAQPFSAGFQEGIQKAGGDSSSIIDRLGAALAGMIGMALTTTGAVFILSGGLTSLIGSAITMMLGSPLWLSWQVLMGAKWLAVMSLQGVWAALGSIWTVGLGGTLAKLAGGLTWAFNMLMAGIGWGLAKAAAGLSFVWSGVVTVIGAGLSAAMAAVTTATGWIVSGVTALMTTLGAAFILFPITIGIGAGIIINTLIPEQTKADARNAWADFIDEAYGVDGLAAAQDYNSQQVVQDGIKSFLNLFRSEADQMRTTYDTITAEELLAGQAAGLETAASRVGTLEGVNTLTTALWDAVRASMRDNNEGSIVQGIQDSIAGGMATGEGANMSGVVTPIVDSITQGVDDANWVAVRDKITSGLLPTPESLGESAAALETRFDGMITAFVAKTDLLDPNAVELNFLAPLRTGFETTFGEASVTRMAFISFFDKIASMTLKMGDDFVALMMRTGASMTGMTIAVSVMSAIISPLLELVTLAIQKLGGEFEELRKKSLKPINLKVSVTYGSFGEEPAGGSGITPPDPAVVDGSHAGGLGRVPFDGYVAELHKNESVLTAAEAQDWRSGVSVKADSLPPVTNNTTNQNNNINIYGVNDVDKIIREFERRGIKVGKR